MNTDCKGIAYTQIPLGRAEDLSNQRYGRLVPKFRVVISSARGLKKAPCGYVNAIAAI